jgi:hypothetical protein
MCGHRNISNSSARLREFIDIDSYLLDLDENQARFTTTKNTIARAKTPTDEICFQTPFQPYCSSFSSRLVKQIIAL